MKLFKCLSLFNKKRVTLINEEWVILYENLELKLIPRLGELIYDEKTSTYYSVEKIIHSINSGKNVCIEVKQINK